MRFRLASFAAMLLAVIALGVFWFVRTGIVGTESSAVPVANSETSATLPAANTSPSVSPPSYEASAAAQVTSSSGTEGGTEDLARSILPNAATWDEVVSSAVSDRAASRSLDYVATLCQILLSPRTETGRLDDPRWLAVAKRCPTRLPDVTQRLATSLPPQSASLDQLALALESGDVMRSDELAASILRSSNDPDELEAATSSYFSPERMRALAGNDRPASLVDAHGALALQVDLTLMVSCSLGSDCAPYSPITLAQCVSTSICQPGQSMQQIIAMRRSPEEVAFLQRMLAYVLQMRKSVR